VFDFENRDALFAAVHRSFKFCVLVIASAKAADFAFFLAHPAELLEQDKRFSLTPAQISKINPNTRTAPIFRSKYDAELTKKIYGAISVLVNDSDPNGNPWLFDYMTKMFDMADNSGDFLGETDLISAGFSALDFRLVRAGETAWVPLYEAKMVHLYDHRWATFERVVFRECTLEEKQTSRFEPRPRYWLPEARVKERLATKNWDRPWLIGWRGICRATDERTLIASVYPATAVANSLKNLFVAQPAALASVFVACLSSLVLDYVERQKVGEINLTVDALKQLPIPSPRSFSADSVSTISSCVVELVYTSATMRFFALDVGYSGPHTPGTNRVGREFARDWMLGAPVCTA